METSIFGKEYLAELEAETRLRANASKEYLRLYTIGSPMKNQ